MKPEQLGLAALLAFTAIAAIGLLLPLPAELQLQRLMNLAHAPLFAGWAWLSCWALTAGAWAGRSPLLRAAALGTLLAAGSEFAQVWIPGRTADWRDFLSNVAGLALGLAVWARWPARRPQH